MYKYVTVTETGTYICLHKRVCRNNRETMY